MQLFTPLEPTVHQIAQFHFEKPAQQSKTRELRPDTLANMLAMANVRPGSRLLVVEDMGGMIVAAAVERMGGASRQPPLSLFVILAPAHARLTPAPREGHRHAQARAAS